MIIWLGRLFLVLIISLGFMQPSVRFAGMSLQATEIVFAAAALVFGAALFFRRGSTTWDRSYFYFAGFAASMAASAVFSESLRVSGIKLAAICYLICLALMTANVVNSEKFFRRVCWFWLSASAFVSLIGVVTVIMFYVDRDSWWNGLFLHHYGSLPPGNYPRIQSTFIYPAMLCNYLTVGATLVIGMWKDGLIGGRLAPAIFSLHLAAALFTVTPGLGGFILAICLAAGWIFLRRQEPVRGIIAICSGVLAAAAFTAVAAVSIWPIETSPYTFGISGYRLDPTQRLLAWQSAWRTFAEHPLVGSGIGTAAIKVVFRAPSGQMQVLTDAHNTWLNVAAQAGLLGVAALAALCVHLVRRGWKALTAGQDMEWTYRCLLIAFVSCFIVQGLVGSFEDARHLWVLIGLVLAGNWPGKALEAAC